VTQKKTMARLTLLAVGFLPVFSVMGSVASAADCDALKGEWNWFQGNVVVIRDDHTVVSNGKFAATWQCVDDARGAATIRWNAGYLDTVTVSGDRISGFNEIGLTITGVRRKPAASKPATGKQPPARSDAPPASTPSSGGR
jgi:hypothetical protein